MVEAGIVNSLFACTRATRYLPGIKGLSTLLRIYNAVLPQPCVRRISDFDGDLSLDVSLRDCIGVNLWHAPEQYERRERQLFCSAVRPGSVVLDVGANIGVFTLLAARRGATVFSIEADPRNADQLRRHVSLNGFDSRVRIIERAAAAAEAELALYRNRTSSGGGNFMGTGHDVPVLPAAMDSLDLPPIDVCRIDVRGFENRVLRGMAATLERSPHLKLLIEYSEPHGRESARELLGFLRSRFESIEVVGKSSLGRTDEPPPYCNLWCTLPLAG